MEPKLQLHKLATDLGFARVHVSKPTRFIRYEEAMQGRTDIQPHLNIDPRETMPECRSVILLVWRYIPYNLMPDTVLPSAYYVASNSAHQAALRLADWFIGRGHNATAFAKIPYKTLAAHTGIGLYGRNGIIAVDQFGSRIALQCVLTDEELPCDELGENRGFSPECNDCRACVKRCPVSALNGDSLVDGTRCLRNQSPDRPFPLAWRKFIGTSLLGCDLCQDSCPRNTQVGREDPPKDLLHAMSLHRLLLGDIADVSGILGKNSPKQKQLQARACLVCGNLKDPSTLPLLEDLQQDESTLVSEAASWAVRQFKEG